MSGSEAEPLFALLELMLRTFTANTAPKIKPGGHPEDIFVNLNDEEKEEIECAICYQILKDVRQCQNKHAFCYSCIFYWSTCGNPINHSRCPVCRVEGLYVRNNALDEKINAKIVKCSMNKCKWKGPLEGLPSHQHTLYSEDANAASTTYTVQEKKTELPAVANSPAPTPVSNSRSRSRASSSHLSTTSSSQTSDNSRHNNPRQPLGTQSLNNSNNSQNTSRTNQRSNGQTTTRSRTRSRHRQNTSSPQRRSNISATGLPNRLTSRARLQNNGTIDNRTVNTQSTAQQSVSSADDNQNQTTETVHVPHPPTTPRPSTTTPRPSQTPRRLPTLPNLLPLNNNSSSNSNNSSINNNNSNNNSNRVTDSQTIDMDNNNNVRPAVPSDMIAESPRRFTLEASIRRQPQTRSFGVIRERLNESRQRLDMLMNVFSVELDRGRQDLTSFQEERERRRQEQLAEVRDLGRRLTQVATELRGLLSQRRQIRTQMDNLLESASDDQEE